MRRITPDPAEGRLPRSVAYRRSATVRRTTPGRSPPPRGAAPPVRRRHPDSRRRFGRDDEKIRNSLQRESSSPLKWLGGNSAGARSATSARGLPPCTRLCRLRTRSPGSWGRLDAAIGSGPAWATTIQGSRRGRSELSSARSGGGHQKRCCRPAGRGAADAALHESQEGAISDWEDIGVNIGEHRRVSTGRTGGAPPSPGLGPRRRSRSRCAATPPSPDGAVVVVAAAAAICRHPPPSPPVGSNGSPWAGRIRPPKSQNVKG